MAAPSDALIKKVCNAFPATFGVDTEEERSPAEGRLSRPFRYYLDTVLGSGTSGTVLYARRVRDDHPFAVKVMDVEGYTPQEIMRASGEVCCLLSCDYFSIVKCHEDFVYSDERNPESVSMMAMVLDYANAGDLRQEIKSRSKTNRPFAEHEAGLIFIQVLLAVHHVHSKRMIHRDIKSANILLCSNGLAKLGDFGFSKHYAATVSEDVGRTFCGTPYYVAPEIWRRRPYSKKADMFSLGVLLYELLTLKRPFDGEDIEEVMHKTLAGLYDPLPDSISKEMQTIVSALLQSEPKKRPSSKTLLNTPTCKLYISVVREIVQSGETGGFSAEQETTIARQLKQTKEELQVDRRRPPLSMEDVLRTTVKVSLSDSPDRIGFILYGGKVMKQSSDLSWKRRYVCIYGEVEKGCTLTDDVASCLVSLELVQAVSRDTLEQQCISTPFSDLEDVFPVISKYTGSDAAHAFAVAFKNGRRILFDADDDNDRDGWMRSIQSFLGIGDEDD
ncbi:putative serine/threonine protein kinase [Leishmania major strain Friedlin]|uniref:non-specific serine/threonine protein kinase n=1 Tax=Leishmania major TaxID=5664 RepID=Q4Q1S3_LEIMA|nr:putative serine/threonine protein kinase [Leishmania major strain Friedlin]CAG9583673.1 serine/threonine_protein_kinase_-_putative [Leishmania major strain Friedlin]CAJ09106.1 putative serine/threonine protein kinase [Leishmania major strain Friedlin]|eukprot:XP_001686725.1 putative serine/threonine protein kinase [Leishmania major strain Friedlin]